MSNEIEQYKAAYEALYGVSPKVEKAGAWLRIGDGPGLSQSGPKRETMRCKHTKGDYVAGTWLCGECFRYLSDRPKTYRMLTGTFAGGPIQEIDWQAEIAIAEGGVPLAKFLAWMVAYLRMRSLWTLSKEDARRECVAVLRDQGEPFGSPDACWSRADAKDLVREGILSYWDDAPSGSNAQ